MYSLEDWGIAIADLNQDGWLDVYVSNDFNEQDYMYLNNHNGTFHNNGIKEAPQVIYLYFSMGSDVAISIMMDWSTL